MTLIITILFLGALLTGSMFLTWKFGQFLSEHGDKFVKVAVALTVLALVYVCVSLWIHPLPGVGILNDAVNKASEVVKSRV